MIIEEEVYLEHFGKKGMKWGQRNNKNKKPLTRAERTKRNEKRAKVVITAVRVAGVGLFIASMMSTKGSTRVSNVKVNKPKSVSDLIDAERHIKISSLKRMHTEGKMDKEQHKNFLKILNDRYDKKIVDAMAGV